MNFSFKNLLNLLAATVALMLMIVAPSSLYAQTCSSLDPLTQVLANRNPFLADLVAQRNFEQSLQKLQTPASAVTKRDPNTSQLVKKLDDLSDRDSLNQVGLNQALRAETRTSSNCLDDGPQNEICRTEVDTPISTAPTLFTQYQAKQAANTAFARLNDVFHNVQQQRLNQQLKQGLKDSTQPKKSNTLANLKRANVVRLQQLLPPHLALSHYFGTPNLDGEALPVQNRTCQTKNQSPSCKRLPFDSPPGVSFNLYSQYSAVSVSAYRVPRVVKVKQAAPKLTFPDVDPLFNQTIQEVALPPPKC